MANDTDLAGLPLSVASFAQGSQGGSVSRSPFDPNVLVYLPSPSAASAGRDDFLSTLSDGQSGSASAVVTLTISSSSGRGNGRLEPALHRPGSVVAPYD